LRQRREDAHAIIPPHEDLREASILKQRAAGELKRLTDHPADNGFNLPVDAPQVIAAQRTLDKATDAFTRITELQATRSAAWQATSAALAECERWLREHGGTTLEAVEIAPPRLAKGESLTDAILRVRRRVRELRADLHRIESAPYPSSHCKARMRVQVEELAQQGAPSLSSLIEHDGKIEWPTQRVRSEVHGEQRSLAFHEAVDVVGMLAFLHKDALIAALDAEIDSEADDKAALSHEQRQKQEAEVMGDLLAVERDEAALVWQAQAQGLPVEHRADCSPQAILQVQLVTPAATNGQASSWMHAWDLVQPGR
jgi:hypothetical protein